MVRLARPLCTNASPLSSDYDGLSVRKSSIARQAPRPDGFAPGSTPSWKFRGAWSPRTDWTSNGEFAAVA
jgi:hypothetical protein